MQSAEVDLFDQLFCFLKGEYRHVWMSVYIEGFLRAADRGFGMKGGYMRSNEERIGLIHTRAARIKRRQEKNIITGIGSLCAVLLVLLFGMMNMQITNKPLPEYKGMYTGSSLLDASVGGYVLTAVIAFMLGVIITAICKKFIKRNNTKGRGQV